MEITPWLSTQYCARQHATASLELWGLVLVLAGAAIATLFAARRMRRTDRRSAARVCAGAFLFAALLTGVLAAAIFYGCTTTAASLQGLGSDLPAATFGMLSCLNSQALGLVHGWMLLVGSFVAAIVLLVLGIVRWNAAARIVAFIAAALLVFLTFAVGLLLIFGFSWCTSQRLI